MALLMMPRAEAYSGYKTSSEVTDPGQDFSNLLTDIYMRANMENKVKRMMRRAYDFQRVKNTGKCAGFPNNLVISFDEYLQSCV